MTLVRFNQVTSIVRGKAVVRGISWTLLPGRNWAIIGPNGAGKTSLLNIILGKLYYRGDFYIAEGLRQQTAYVSFDRQSRMLHREAEKDHARHFSGNLSLDRMTAGRFLLSDDPDRNRLQQIADVTRRLHIAHILDREIQRLSTGEMRKLLIADALIAAPKLLVLDEPFSGLDDDSRKSLKRMINDVIGEGLQVLLVVHRFEDIPARITHVLCMQDGAVFHEGPRATLDDKQLVQNLYGLKPAPAHLPDRTVPPSRMVFNSDSDDLVQMADVTVKYGRTVILDTINWQVKKGENWYISGPNGAGKSTLIRLITADEPQAYANKVFLFGKQRGTGESIWDIKQKIGLISSEFQIRYKSPHVRLTAYQVVLSGFFDSVGLFRNASGSQRQTAWDWLRHLGLAAFAEREFAHLSYGEQRMVLIARAMVKYPELLILDEPFQGVDHANRKMLLALIDTIGNQTDTGILYVTHQRDPLTCITHTLRFERRGDGGYTVVIKKQNPF